MSSEEAKNKGASGRSGLVFERSVSRQRMPGYTETLSLAGARQALGT